MAIVNPHAAGISWKPLALGVQFEPEYAKSVR